MPFNSEDRDSAKTLKVITENARKEYLMWMQKRNDLYSQFLHRAVGDYEEHEDRPLYCGNCHKTTDYKTVVPIRERPIKYIGYPGPDFTICVWCKYQWTTQEDDMPHWMYWKKMVCRMCGALYYEHGGNREPRFECGYLYFLPWCSLECYQTEQKADELKWVIKKYKNERGNYYDQESRRISASENQQPVQSDGCVH